MSEHSELLSRKERVALGLLRFANERAVPKWIQLRFLRSFTYWWVRQTIAPRLYIDGMKQLASLEPDRGVVLAANHRSFFDMYVVMLGLFHFATPWARRIYFPVRSNFFYETFLGIAMNFAVGGGSMYPPIFRDAAKAELNKDALARTVEALQDPHTIVGLHPEGTRGKGPDPHELLPAQPGVGQIVLQAKPIVVPLFVNGLPNDFVKGLRATYRKQARREEPVIVVVGEPLDYSEFTKKKPRAALYKRCADKMNQAIIQLGERERGIRAACLRGEVSDSDPHWLLNNPRLS